MPPDSSAIPQDSPPHALVIADGTDLRQRLVRGMRDRGWAVEAVDEPYAASARIGEGSFDLVLAFLSVFDRGDLAFFESLRSRWPATRAVALVGERERRRAHAAIRKGATSWLQEPLDETDVDALVNLFLPSAGPLPTLQLLSRELAHLLGNRLMRLRMIADDENFPPSERKAQIQAVDELSASQRLLNRLYDLRPHRRKRTRLRAVLLRGLGPLAMRGRILEPESKAGAGPYVLGDENALCLAVEAAVDGLLGLAAPEKAKAVQVRVVRAKDRYASFLRHATSRPEVVEGRVWIDGLEATQDELQALRQQLLWRQDVSGTVHWGGWLPTYLVGRDGGELQFRRRPGATGVAFVFVRE